MATNSKPAQKPTRKQRLAEQLRANLRKRKDQNRQRRQIATSEPDNEDNTNGTNRP